MTSQLTEEQKRKIAENRQLALLRRLSSQNKTHTSSQHGCNSSSKQQLSTIPNNKTFSSILLTSSTPYGSSKPTSDEIKKTTFITDRQQTVINSNASQGSSQIGFQYQGKLFSKQDSSVSSTPSHADNSQFEKSKTSNYSFNSSAPSTSSCFSSKLEGARVSNTCRPISSTCQHQSVICSSASQVTSGSNPSRMRKLNPSKETQLMKKDQFYGLTGANIKGKCLLISMDRFAVEVSYHESLVEFFREMETRSYGKNLIEHVTTILK